MTAHEDRRQADTGGRSFADGLLSAEAQAIVLSKRPKTVAKSAVLLLTARSLEERLSTPSASAVDPNDHVQTAPATNGIGERIEEPSSDHVRQVLDELQKTYPDLFEKEPDVPEAVQAKETVQPTKESVPLFRRLTGRRTRTSNPPDSKPESESELSPEDKEPDRKDSGTIYQDKLRALRERGKALHQSAQAQAMRAADWSRDRITHVSSRVSEIRIPRTAILSLVALIGIGILSIIALQTFRSGSPDDGSLPPSGEIDRNGPSSEPVPETRPQTQAKEPEPAIVEPSASDKEIAGRADVLTTGLLKIGERELQLFGVEGRRGAEVEDFKKYLGDRSVRCVSVEGSQAYRCNVADRDLSEVVVFNGGGRVSAEATSELVAAEDHARAARLGLWKNQ